MLNLLSMSLLKRECVGPYPNIFCYPNVSYNYFCLVYNEESTITISIVHGSGGSGNLNLVMARLRQP